MSNNKCTNIINMLGLKSGAAVRHLISGQKILTNQFVKSGLRWIKNCDFIFCCGDFIIFFVETLLFLLRLHYFSYYYAYN